MDLQEMKKDILVYDLYEVLDDIPYGDYYLTILNENDKIIIHISDYEGSAAHVMDKE